MDAIRSESEPWSVFLRLGGLSLHWPDKAHTLESLHKSVWLTLCKSTSPAWHRESALSCGAVFVLRDLNKYEERSIVRLFGLRVSEARLFRFPQLSDAVLFFPSTTQIRSQQSCFEKALSLSLCVRLACHVSPNFFLSFFPSSRAA